MQKNGLANIVVQRSMHRKIAPPHVDLMFKPRTSQEARSSTVKQLSKSSNKTIKITQFSSSLLLGDSSVNHRAQSSNYSTSPQKNFTIKRINDIKNRVVSNTQKIIDIELKRRESMNARKAQLQPDSNTNNKKVIVLNKWAPDECSRVDFFNLGNCSPHAVMVFKPNPTSPGNRPQIQGNVNGELIEGVSGQFKSIVKGSPTKQSQKQMRPNKSEADKQKNPERKWSASPRKSYNKHIVEQKKYQQNLERQKRQILQMKKELNKNYAKPFYPPQNVSAFSYIVYEMDVKRRLRKGSAKRNQADEQRKLYQHSHQVIVSLNSRTAAEMASLTKIMTCLVVLSLSQQYDVDLTAQMVTIGAFQQNIGGTSACIRKGEVYSVWQLLHGLMLPSGNDASLALAVWGGRLLLSRQLKVEQMVDGKSKIKKREAYERFVAQMNKQAALLNLEKTKYCNSHGLSHPQNRSCPFDLAVLCQQAMSNPQFRHIVSRKTYQCEVPITNSVPGSPLRDSKRSTLRASERFSEEGLEAMEMQDLQGESTADFGNEEQEVTLAESQGQSVKQVRWVNTHPLLQSKSDLYIGIKTGITTTAGPCLASCLECRGRRFVIVVLNCKSIKQRNKDTEILRKWVFSREGLRLEREEREERDCQEVEGQQ